MQSQHAYLYWNISRYSHISRYGVYSKNNLPKIKDEAFVINLDEFKSIETYGIALYVNGNNVIYFDKFETEGPKEILEGPKEIKNVIGHKNITTKIYRI